MAFIATRGSIVSTTAGTLFSLAETSSSDIPANQGVDVSLRVSAGTAVLGGPGVKPWNGYALVPNQPLKLNLDYGETLCAIRPTSGTTTVHILTSTRD